MAWWRFCACREKWWSGLGASRGRGDACWVLVVAGEEPGRGVRGELDSAAMEDGSGMVVRRGGRELGPRLGTRSEEAKSKLASTTA